VTALPAGWSRPPVPVRTILATIGLVLGAALALYLLVETRRALTWLVVPAFFAVALSPLAAMVQRRLLGDRWRALVGAGGVELLGVLGALLAIPVAGMIHVIVRDLWDHRRGRLKEDPPSGRTAGPRSPRPTAGQDHHPLPPGCARRSDDLTPRLRPPARRRATRPPGVVADRWHVPSDCPDIAVLDDSVRFQP
jgi:hypothetical protein